MLVLDEIFGLPPCKYAGACASGKSRCAASMSSRALHLGSAIAISARYLPIILSSQLSHLAGSSSHHLMIFGRYPFSYLKYLELVITSIAYFLGFGSAELAMERDKIKILNPKANWWVSLHHFLLVGGLEHSIFFQMYLSKSSQLTFRGVGTTNLYIHHSPWLLRRRQVAAPAAPSQGGGGGARAVGDFADFEMGDTLGSF